MESDQVSAVRFLASVMPSNTLLTARDDSGVGFGKGALFARERRAAQLDATMKEVAALRRQVQYAVDAAWPASRKAHAATRVEFKLSPNRALQYSLASTGFRSRARPPRRAPFCGLHGVCWGRIGWGPLT
jgi:hypothetical protein